MSNRSLKVYLHKRNPKCHWCQRETILTNIPNLKRKTTDPLMATIDHVVSRFNPERWVKRKEGEVRKVLACFECNNRRSTEEQLQKSKEELSRRGQGYCLNPRGKPIITRPLNSIEEVLDTLKNMGIVVTDANKQTVSDTESVGK